MPGRDPTAMAFSFTGAGGNNNALSQSSGTGTGSDDSTSPAVISRGSSSLWSMAFSRSGTIYISIYCKASFELTDDPTQIEAAAAAEDTGASGGARPLLRQEYERASSATSHVDDARSLSFALGPPLLHDRYVRIYIYFPSMAKRWRMFLHPDAC